MILKILLPTVSVLALSVPIFFPSSLLAIISTEDHYANEKASQPPGTPQVVSASTHEVLEDLLENEYTKIKSGEANVLLDTESHAKRAAVAAVEATTDAEKARLEKERADAIAVVATAGGEKAAAQAVKREAEKGVEEAEKREKAANTELADAEKAVVQARAEEKLAEIEEKEGLFKE